MSDTIVELKGVSKLYVSYRKPIDRLVAHFIENALKRDPSRYRKRHLALTNIDLRLREGESMGILGMNGAGKSTLLQIIAKTLQPSTGHVQTRGRIAALLELGSGFNPEFTGRENAYLNAKILGLTKSEIQDKIDDVLEFAEIGDFVDRPLKTYSSGMTVRLAFSVLTQIDPAVFIIDEALSVGDAYFRHKSAKFIRNFRERGGTLLFCSHDMEAVRTLCDSAILLESGKIIEEGKSQRVVDYYNALISRKQKNFDVGQHLSGSGRCVTRSGSREIEICNVTLSDSEEAERNVFQRGEEARVSIELVVNRPVDELTVGMRIADRIGTTVFGVNTFHLRQPISECKTEEKIKVVFAIPLVLGPGEYSITVAAHSEDSHLKDNYDWIDNIIALTVTRRPEDPLTIGCCYLPPTLTIERKS